MLVLAVVLPKEELKLLKAAGVERESVETKDEGAVEAAEDMDRYGCGCRIADW